MPGDLSKSIGLNTGGGTGRMYMRGPNDTEVGTKGSDLSAYGPCSPLISPPPRPSTLTPFLRPNSVCGIRDRYILRFRGTFHPFSPSNGSIRPMTLHAATTNPRRAPKQGVVNVNPLSSPPCQCHPRRARRGTRLRTSSLHNSEVSTRHISPLPPRR